MKKKSPRGGPISDKSSFHTSHIIALHLLRQSKSWLPCPSILSLSYPDLRHRLDLLSLCPDHEAGAIIIGFSPIPLISGDTIFYQHHPLEPALLFFTPISSVSIALSPQLLHLFFVSYCFSSYLLSARLPRELSYIAPPLFFFLRTAWL